MHGAISARRIRSLARRYVVDAAYTSLRFAYADCFGTGTWHSQPYDPTLNGLVEVAR